MMTSRHCVLLTALACACAATTEPVIAHPHVWVTMKSEIVYAPDGSVKAVRHAWQFDDLFSAFATQGLDATKKGEFTRQELAPLAQVNVDSLKEFDYFTFATADGKKVPFVEPVDYYLNYDPKQTVLTLHFTLPFKDPVIAKDLRIDVYDQTWFVDFGFVKKTPVTLVGAPAACKLSVVRPAQMDSTMMLRLNQLPADAQVDPSMFLGNQFANKIGVKCP